MIIILELRILMPWWLEGYKHPYMVHPWEVITTIGTGKDMGSRCNLGAVRQIKGWLPSTMGALNHCLPMLGNCRRFVVGSEEGRLYELSRLYKENLSQFITKEIEDSEG